MDVIFKACHDIRCFDDSHRQCPICSGIIHVISLHNVELKKCKTKICQGLHLLCTDCYKQVHVTML